MQLDQLDNLVIEALTDLNQVPATFDNAQLDVLLTNWTQYSEVVSWAAVELQAVASTEEVVSPIKSDEDLSEFQMEFSGLLKELGCPYNSILEQGLQARFDSVEKRKVLLNFVLSELQAARMIYVHRPSKQQKLMEVELDESGTAKVLREIIMELGLGKPPDSISAAELWSKINGKVGPMMKGNNKGPLGPLFEGFLSPAQWAQLETIFRELQADYTKRREMLLKRLDVTVKSFHWSDRLKGQKEKEINDKFERHRPKLSGIPAVALSDVLAARIDLPIVEKTASASVRKNTKSAINNVVIGRVPDRGGRTDEIQPPPPEMPPWQQRQGGAPAGTSGWIQGGQQRGRGGGRGGGGRVQGGWSDSGQRGGGNQYQGGGGDRQNNYQQQQYDNRGGGGYQQQQQYDNRGGGYSQQSYNNSGGGGGYNQSYNNSGGGGGGGYYQHDNRGGGGGSYHDQGGGRNYGDQQGGRRDRYDDRDNYRGGRGGRGGGRRY